MQPRSPLVPRRDRSASGCVIRGLKAYAAFLLIVVVVPLGAAHLYAWWRLAREEAAWAKDFEPMQALLRRHPKADASPGAKRLDGLARPLGIVFIGTSPEAGAALKALGAYLDLHMAAGEEGIHAAPPTATGYLAEHAAEIEEIEGLLLGGESVSWPLDLETGFDVPLPNLLAHRQLQTVLLAKALDAARRGRAKEAQRAMEASWASNQAMARRPEIVTQLIAIVGAGMQAGLLRCLPTRPEPWAERIVEHRFRTSALTSLQLEAHIFGFLGRGFIGVTDIAAIESGGGPPRGPAHVIVRLLSAPYLKLSVAGYSERLRLTAEELKRRNPCDVDVDALSEQAKEAIPRWNTIARVALPSVIRAWRPGVVMDLDAERTRVVIENGRGGTPASFASQVCPGLVWQVTDDADGFRTVAPKGLELPRRVPPGWTFRLRGPA